MSLLREIQNDLATAFGDLTIVLRKCKILAARLGSDQFARWVEFELNGYPESQPTPDYRRLDIRYYANFMNIAWQAPQQPVPLQLIPEEYRDSLISLEFRDGIAKAVSFARAKNGVRLQRPELIFMLQGKMYPQMNCTGVWGEIGNTEFEQLVSSVQNRILDFSLKIEAQNPDAGEAQPNTRPVPKEKLQPLVQNVFYGAVGAVAQNSENFNQNVNPGVELHDLNKLVIEFTNHLDELGLDQRQMCRAEAQIAALKAELAGDPDPAILKQTGRTLRNIAEGAIGSLLATATQPTIWHWIHQTLTALGGG